MNSRFDALRDAIPGPSKLKSTRAGILAAAVSHIQQLEAEKAELKARLEMSSDETITQMDTGTVHNMATDISGFGGPTLIQPHTKHTLLALIERMIQYTTGPCGKCFVSILELKATLLRDT